MLPEPHKIPDIIYKTLKGQLLESDEWRLHKKCIRSSAYYRSLLNDTHTDQRLRRQLVQSFPSNKNDFWKIVICYRAAYHNGMPQRAGNFWERNFLFRK